jgi:predicted small lipoprotein YifL
MSFNGKKGIAILAALLITASLAGCGGESAVTSSESAVSADVSTAASDDITDDEMFTDRDKEVGYDESEAVSIALSDDGITCDSDLVTVDGSTVTISGEGTFLLSGTLTDGQIIVDAAKTDKLQLVLDNVDINCNTSAPLYVRQADKVFVTLAAGSDNKLTNQEDFVAIYDNNIDSVIFSKDDLTLNGSGSLTVEAQYGHGIVSKDDLVITGGTYTITSPGHALSGKDSIRVADGTFTLTTGKDGLTAKTRTTAA